MPLPHDIAAAIKSDIMADLYMCGTRIRTRRQLEQDWSVSSVTAQRALDLLAKDGFTESRGRHGTFVVPQPPHLHNFGLVFENTPDSHTWSTFQDSLRLAAEALQEEGAFTFEPFFGISYHTDDEVFQRLIARVQRHCLAGVFVWGQIARRLCHHPAFRQTRTPLCFFSSGEPQEGMNALRPEGVEFYHLAFERMKAWGCARPAVFSIASPYGRQTGRLDECLAESGYSIPRHWQLYLAPSCQEGAAAATELVLSVPNPPDALLVTDDNLVAGVAEGIGNAGVRVPEELYVVARANFPLTTPCGLPFVRIGNDVEAFLKSGIGQMRRQRLEGADATTIEHAPLVFERQYS